MVYEMIMKLESNFSKINMRLTSIRLTSNLNV